MLEDAALVDAVIERIRTAACNAEWALLAQRDALLAVFDSLDDAYLRTRRDDVAHVVERLLAGGGGAGPAPAAPGGGGAPRARPPRPAGGGGGGAPRRGGRRRPGWRRRWRRRSPVTSATRVSCGLG
jgi:hypothetical protein